MSEDLREILKRNGEILYLYDAKMCNPNGDPDDENKPRMDYEREKNLVSDVRLKRYVRDYLQDKGYKIYISKAEGVKDATNRLEHLLGKKAEQGDREKLLDMLVDVRFFGATMPIKGGSKGESGQSITYIGPVQFNWGYSLNRVNLVDSVTITSQLASEAKAQQGTFGKDYRVYYSLLAFHGIIGARRAEFTRMTYGDLNLLDEAMLKAIPLLATRSKIGQYPRLYARFVYTDADTFAGDFREDLALVKEEGLRDIREAGLELDGLRGRIERVSGRIEKVFVWQDPNLKLFAEGCETTFTGWLQTILGVERVAAFPGV